MGGGQLIRRLARCHLVVMSSLHGGLPGSARGRATYGPFATPAGGAGSHKLGLASSGMVGAAAVSGRCGARARAW